MSEKIRTSAMPTWCPGCTNHMILAAFQRLLEEHIKSGKKKEDFALVSGIGCHAKIFDYMDLPGINTLHGRVLPTCVGVKLAKPKVHVFGFSGDGDAYAEGMEHLVHTARYNSDLNYIVNNNQVFALTLGEPSPVTELGFIDKTNPMGNRTRPLNPIALMLSAGATFVARAFADIESLTAVFREAKNHKGFSFIEILQPCIIFHADKGYKERMYSLEKAGHNRKDFGAAMKKAEEFDYNSKDSKIPMGVFYQVEKPTFEEIQGL